MINYPGFATLNFPYPFPGPAKIFGPRPLSAIIINCCLREADIYQSRQIIKECKANLTTRFTLASGAGGVAEIPQFLGSRARVRVL